MKMRAVFTVLVGIFVSNVLLCQNVLLLIPAESSSVQVIRADRLNDVYNIRQLTEEERYLNFRDRFDHNRKETWNGIAAMMMYEMGTNGISDREMFYTYEMANDSVSSWAYLFQLNSVENFETYLTENLDLEDVQKKVIGDRFSYIQKQSYAIVWNKSSAMIFSGVVRNGYLQTNEGKQDYYLEELSEKERTEKDHRLDELKAQVLKREFSRLFQLKFEESILSDKNFMGVYSGVYDAFYYRPRLFTADGLKLLSGSEYDEYEAYGTEITTSRDVPKEVNPLFENNYYFNYWTFGKEQAASETVLRLNQTLIAKLQKVQKSKFNKQFFKYVSGNELMGYYSVCMNSARVISLLEDLDVDLLGFGDVGNTETASVLRTLMDDEKVNNLFGGTALYAVTDMYEADVRYESYSYDPETYERERIIKTRKEPRPEFVVLITVNNPETVEAFFENRESTNQFINIGNYYRIKSENNQYDPKAASVDKYIAYRDNILIITNNEEIMIQHPEGYPKSMQLSSEWQKKISASPVSGYWNLDKLAKSVDEGYLNIPGIGNMLINYYTGSFDEFSITAFDIMDQKAVINADFRIKKEDPVSVRFNLIDLMTGLGGKPHPLLNYF